MTMMICKVNNYTVCFLMIENDGGKMTGFNGTVNGWDHRGKGVRVGMRGRARVRGLFVELRGGCRS